MEGAERDRLSQNDRFGAIPRRLPPRTSSLIFFAFKFGQHPHLRYRVLFGFGIVSHDRAHNGVARLEFSDLRTA